MKLEISPSKKAVENLISYSKKWKLSLEKTIEKMLKNFKEDKGK